MLIRAIREFLKKNQRKRAADGRDKRQEVTKFEEKQYVLLKYPKKPPDKLSGLYRPMEIVAMDRPDIVKVRDLTTDKVVRFHFCGPNAGEITQVLDIYIYFFNPTFGYCAIC